MSGFYFIPGPELIRIRVKIKKSFIRSIMWN